MQWLRMLAILAEHRHLILSIHVAQDPIPSFGLCGHPHTMHVHTERHTYMYTQVK